jgi:hypothetical protein
MSKFDDATKINVNDKTEKKGTLTYLSWAWAWAEFKKVYPDAQYEVVKFADGKPYYHDDKTGYMVYTKVTAEGLTYEMWLPVMDGANNAMKSERYEIQTKYKKITVEPATMFDINKTIMRCLTKNLAMFGLGLYIYAGEDLPEDEKSNDEMSVETYKKLHSEIHRAGVSIKSICAAYKVDDLGKLTEKQAQAAIKKIASKPTKQVYDAGNQV